MSLLAILSIRRKDNTRFVRAFIAIE